MTFLAMTALVALLFLAVDLILRLRKRGRTVLALIYLTWAVIDAILSARQNRGHEFGAFAISFFDSLAPLVLWQWVSSWIRQSRERRNSGGVSDMNAAQQTEK